MTSIIKVDTIQDTSGKILLMKKIFNTITIGIWRKTTNIEVKLQNNGSGCWGEVTLQVSSLFIKQSKYTNNSVTKINCNTEV
ncbi:MAG: hypothetical protein CM15mV128_180 [Caudoviricetes sp.]|nr:MAG: hypothetical protein CM15mV128_180 [Caudoviricetes sp.]